MLAYALSDIGKVRETNEDSFVCQPPLFVVADGMGGHVAGEVASRVAADTVSARFAGAGGEEPTALLSEAIIDANDKVYRLAQEDSERAGMGTTLTAAFVAGSVLYWGHVGDSRLYLLRGGVLSQVSEDHSLVGELVRNGSITADEALIHPHRNILTRAVGTGDRVKVDTGSLTLAAGDKVLLCTDGLTNMVTDGEIAAALSRDGDGAALLAQLVARANDAGGLDNITAILVCFEAV
ncbi:Stp1/IreP family PP2C-type Ser/Thr phosphatase [Anaeroselena agilis]|uniref:Stp1/IreP family PP2C-type Ser/Thr phosphatase n=1 Tax=Anaeroselena agilis TaxID=3063788 RepID=A0ABU3NYX4_9FIRM|nr:Stp1/IreP family PP2C-type Ser/Thr phosphatase [Selenomonadales bacterium 4137-cl]